MTMMINYKDNFIDLERFKMTCSFPFFLSLPDFGLSRLGVDGNEKVP